MVTRAFASSPSSFCVSAASDTLARNFAKTPSSFACSRPLTAGETVVIGGCQLPGKVVGEGDELLHVCPPRFVLFPIRVLEVFLELQVREQLFYHGHQGEGRGRRRLLYARARLSDEPDELAAEPLLCLLCQVYLDPAVAAAELAQQLPEADGRLLGFFY